MRFSHTNHFWTWFQRNSDLLLTLPKMEDAERQFWMREIDTHLRAYTKRLFCEYVFPQKGPMQLIITAYGKSKYFRMAENFVAKAPRMLGWKIVALQPPGMITQWLVPMYGRCGIDVEKLWFLPAEASVPHGKVVLHIYAELYQQLSSEMEISIEAVLFDLLGERTMGLQVERFKVRSIFYLSQEEKDRLLKIEELPAWLDNNTLSDWVVNEKGELDMRKPKE